MELGGYTILETLGSGGMGAVYTARHNQLGIERAIKVMARATPEAQARFEREARALAGVRHRNVVGVHEIGVENGQPFFVMDLVHGASLAERLQEGPLPWREGLKVAVGICRGVGALHAAGIVHRDLKPANVVLAEDGRPVVIDLGLAVAPESDERLTKTGSMVGTLHYMAPEQFAGRVTDPRVDVHALGLVVYETLTGEPAIADSGDGVHALSAAIISGPRPAPSDANPDVPLALDAVCQRAMDRDPAARFADAGALGDALELLLEAPGPTGIERRRQRSLLAGLGLTAVVLPLVAVTLLDTDPKPTPPTPPTTPSRPTAPTTPAPTTPPPPALSAQEVEEGTAELRELRRERDMRVRLQKVRTWLERYPGHPRTERAQRVRDELALRFPLRMQPVHRPDALAFTPAGVVVINVERKLFLFDLDLEKQLRVWKLPFRPYALAAPPPGATLQVKGRHGDVVAVAGTAGQVAVVDLGSAPDAKPLLRRRYEQLRALRAVAFSPDGALLAAGGDGPDIGLLSTADLSLVRSFGPHEAPVRCLAFAEDAALLVSGCGKAARAAGTEDHAVRFFDVATGKQRREIRQGVMVESLAVHGETILAGNSAGQLILLRGATDPERYLEAPNLRPSFGAASTAFAHLGSVRGIAFSPDGARFYSVGNITSAPGGEFRTWDAARAAPLSPGGADLIPPIVRDVDYDGVAVSPDGRRAAVWSGEKIELWELPSY